MIAKPVKCIFGFSFELATKESNGFVTFWSSNPRPLSVPIFAACPAMRRHQRDRPQDFWGTRISQEPEVVEVSLHAGRHSDAALTAPVVTVADKDEAAAPRKENLVIDPLRIASRQTPCSATSKKKHHLLVHVPRSGSSMPHRSRILRNGRMILDNLSQLDYFAGEDRDSLQRAACYGAASLLGRWSTS